MLETDFTPMKDYLPMCVREENWQGVMDASAQGVMDASADIREILAKRSILRGS